MSDNQKVLLQDQVSTEIEMSFLHGFNFSFFLIQGVSLVLMAHGECKASWPCRAHWAITH